VGSEMCIRDRVEGRLRMDSWEDKQSGQKRTKLLVSADTVQFTDGAPREGGRPSSEQDRSEDRSEDREAASPSVPPAGFPADDEPPF